MKLSQNQAKELRERLQAILQPYYTHQGWPGLDVADSATQDLIDYLRELQVRL